MKVTHFSSTRRIGLLAVMLLAALMLLPRSSSQPAEASGQNDRALAAQAAQQGKVRVIVQVRSKADQPIVAQEARGQGARLLRQYDNFALLALEVNENALRGLLRSPRVVSVEVDRADPPALNNSLPVINAGDVHNLGWDGSGVTVVILDTGIDRNHPFVQGRVTGEACFSSPDGDANHDSLCPNGGSTQTGAGSANIEIDACRNAMGNNICDHGPHVAGIAAGDGTGVANAPAAGVAPGANIIAMQVFTRFNDADDCGDNPAPCVRTFASDQIAALDRVLTLSATNNIAAVNMSLGGGMNTTACDGDSRKTAIDSLIGANIATVIAGGNSGFGNAVGAPGCISTAITIGATNNADNLAGFTNRGTLLDLFAPGVGNISAISVNAGTGFGSKSGTSMASPHVTGAWAVLRQAYPSLTVAQTLALLRDTGVPITYMTGPGVFMDPDDNSWMSWNTPVTTRRIDLLAALQGGTQPPVLTVNQASVTVNEGSTASNTGTFSDPDGDPVTLTASVGTVVKTGASTWSWSFTPLDGPAQSQTVTITGTDDKGVTGTVTFALTVHNVAPTVAISPAQVTLINEGQSLLVQAAFTDPGILDAPFTASVQCYNIPGFGQLTVPGSVQVTSATAPLLHGQVVAYCPYGDTSQSGAPPAGAFTVTVSVTDKDGGSGSANFGVQVANVGPTVSIDKSGATLINGVPTFIAQNGVPLDFSAQVTDPGSDDLTLTWDWADGLVDLATYLVNPPGTDPFPSPSVQPRDVTDEQTHAWADACLFVIGLSALDDDGGSGLDQAHVIITGDSGYARSAGFWQHQYQARGRSHFDSATLDCYLLIVGHMSAVFDEVRVGTASKAAAAQVLHVAGSNKDLLPLLDQQLLAAWLNFANGAYGWNDLVDTNGDGVPDTPFSAAVQAAEAVRLDPNASRAALEEQKNILESINLMHGG